MKRKTFLYLMMITILLAVVCLTGGMIGQPNPQLTKNVETDNKKEGPAPGKNMTVAGPATDSLKAKLGYDLIEKKEAKTGNSYCYEMGLYWGRTDIQLLFYTDVQEVCEKAFGDYLSPLQGLADIVGGTNERYRTDKQTAVINPKQVQFYLFIQNNIALVTIDDKGDTYDTSFQILRDDETQGIKVLTVPPLGGIGIAGTDHVPEKQNYDTHKLVTNGEMTYSKADIQYVFNADLQKIAEEVFGNYVQALQGLYTLTEQEGYGYSVPFWREDMSCDVLPKDCETTVIRDNYCEFTIIANARRRIRVSITKKGNQYITTFRMLKDGEFKVKEYAG